MAAALSVLLGLAALIIESNRLRVTVFELQSIADSAATAAAHELDGTQSGWLRAKRLAASIIKSQYLTGVGNTTGSIEVIFNQGGKPDPLEDAAEFKDVGASIGKISFTIERGFYGVDQKSSTPDKLTFTSLEGKSPSGITDSQGRALPLMYALPSYMLANSVEITANVTGVRKLLGRFLSSSDSFGTLARSATALSDEKLEECVVPAAIPACSLMLDLDPKESRSYYTDLYKAESQCQRETVISEANPLGPVGEGYFPDRNEGVSRSELYPAYPKYLTGYNKKALPLSGVLGVADEGAAIGSKVKNSEILDVFRRGCINVRLGARFKPLENAVGSGGLYEAHGDELAAQLRMQLSESARSQTFADVFGDPDNVSEHKPNYPRLRSEPDELLIEYPFANSKLARVVLSPPSKPSNWTNPMCHDYDGSPPNDPRSGVKDVVLMVVSPTKVNDYSNAGSYCDFKRVFGGKQAKTTAPTGDTDPIVIGFVRAKLFDFNFTDYGVSGSPDEILDNSPSRYEIIPAPEKESNSGKPPALDAVTNAARTFVTQHLDWATCESKRKCEPGEPESAGCRKKDCSGKKSEGGLKGQLSEYLSVSDQCIKKPNIAAFDACCNSNNLTEAGTSCADFMASLDEAGSAPSPKAYCLPERDPTCTDTTEEGCFSALKPRAPQYGCGGLRVRLDCEQQPTLTQTKALKDRVPSIVR
jgi:hypothetical protein